MKMSGNTILITGGGTGIGLALAKRFIQEDNQVVIVGRRKEKLLEAKKAFPRLDVKECDLNNPIQRQGLVQWILEEYPGLNVLVNNAGIQRQIDLSKGPEDLLNGEDEIGINFAVPVYLSAMLIPHLSKQSEAAIINVTGGLAFVPLTILPIYCATKAALHSYSLSLRYQLRQTHVKVFEIIPPTVDTDLDHGARARRKQENRGIPAAEMVEPAFAGMAKDEFEIAIGQAQGLRSASPQEAGQIFLRMNGNW